MHMSIYDAYKCAYFILFKYILIFLHHMTFTSCTTLAFERLITWYFTYWPCLFFIFLHEILYINKKYIFIYLYIWTLIHFIHIYHGVNYTNTVLLIQHSLTQNKQTILTVSNSHLINTNTNTNSVQIKLIGMQDGCRGMMPWCCDF